MKKLSVFCVALALATSLVGCENKVDTEPNVLPESAADSGATNDTAAAGDVAADACGCLKPGMWYRFTKLKITEIDLGPHNVTLALNPLWSNDIKNYELNFYVEVLNVTPTEVQMRVVNGARKVNTVDETCLILPTAATLTHPRAGCELGESAPAAMNVYAGTPAHPKNCTDKLPVHHAIPVRNAIMKSIVSDDCTQLHTGRVVDGSFSRNALEKTCTCLTAGGKKAEDCGEPDPKFEDDEKLCGGCNSNFTNLRTLLEGFGKLDYKCKSPSGGPAACLKAEFEAERIDTAPVACD